jgi:hypothetical protein
MTSQALHLPQVLLQSVKEKNKSASNNAAHNTAWYNVSKPSISHSTGLNFGGGNIVDFSTFFEWEEIQEAKNIRGRGKRHQA